MEKEKDPTLKDIFEVVTFIKDNAVNKKELKEDLIKLKEELKLEIGKARDEAFAYADKKPGKIIVEVDKIINKYAEHENKFKHELVSAMKRNSLLGAKDLEQLGQAI